MLTYLNDTAKLEWTAQLVPGNYTLNIPYTVPSGAKLKYSVKAKKYVDNTEYDIVAQAEATADGAINKTFDIADECLVTIELQAETSNITINSLYAIIQLNFDFNQFANDADGLLDPLRTAFANGYYTYEGWADDYALITAFGTGLTDQVAALDDTQDYASYKSRQLYLGNSNPVIVDIYNLMNKAAKAQALWMKNEVEKDGGLQALWDEFVSEANALSQDDLEDTSARYLAIQGLKDRAANASDPALAALTAYKAGYDVLEEVEGNLELKEDAKAKVFDADGTLHNLYGDLTAEPGDKSVVDANSQVIAQKEAREIFETAKTDALYQDGSAVKAAVDAAQAQIDAMPDTYDAKAGIQNSLDEYKKAATEDGPIKTYLDNVTANFAANNALDPISTLTDAIKNIGDGAEDAVLWNNNADARITQLINWVRAAVETQNGLLNDAKTANPVYADLVDAGLDAIKNNFTDPIDTEGTGYAARQAAGKAAGTLYTGTFATDMYSALTGKTDNPDADETLTELPEDPFKNEIDAAVKAVADQVLDPTTGTLAQAKAQFDANKTAIDNLQSLLDNLLTLGTVDESAPNDDTEATPANPSYNKEYYSVLAESQKTYFDGLMTEIQTKIDGLVHQYELEAANKYYDVTAEADYTTVNNAVMAGASATLKAKLVDLKAEKDVYDAQLAAIGDDASGLIKALNDANTAIDGFKSADELYEPKTQNTYADEITAVKDQLIALVNDAWGEGTGTGSRTLAAATDLQTIYSAVYADEIAAGTKDDAISTRLAGDTFTNIIGTARTNTYPTPSDGTGLYQMIDNYQDLAHAALDNYDKMIGTGAAYNDATPSVGRDLARLNKIKTDMHVGEANQLRAWTEADPTYASRWNDVKAKLDAEEARIKALDSWTAMAGDAYDASAFDGNVTAHGVYDLANMEANYSLDNAAIVTKEKLDEYEAIYNMLYPVEGNYEVQLENQLTNDFVNVYKHDGTSEDQWLGEEQLGTGLGKELLKFNNKTLTTDEVSYYASAIEAGILVKNAADNYDGLEAIYNAIVADLVTPVVTPTTAPTRASLEGKSLGDIVNETEDVYNAYNKLAEYAGNTGKIASLVAQASALQTYIAAEKTYHNSLTGENSALTLKKTALANQYTAFTSDDTTDPAYNATMRKAYTDEVALGGTFTKLQDAVDEKTKTGGIDDMITADIETPIANAYNAEYLCYLQNNNIPGATTKLADNISTLLQNTNGTSKAELYIALTNSAKKLVESYLAAKAEYDDKLQKVDNANMSLASVASYVLGTDISPEMTVALVDAASIKAVDAFKAQVNELKTKTGGLDDIYTNEILKNYDDWAYSLSTTDADGKWGAIDTAKDKILGDDFKLLDNILSTTEEDPGAPKQNNDAFTEQINAYKAAYVESEALIARIERLIADSGTADDDELYQDGDDEVEAGDKNAGDVMFTAHELHLALSVPNEASKELDPADPAYRTLGQDLLERLNGTGKVQDQLKAEAGVMLSKLETISSKAYNESNEADGFQATHNAITSAIAGVKGYLHNPEFSEAVIATNNANLSAFLAQEALVETLYNDAIKMRNQYNGVKYHADLQPGVTSAVNAMNTALGNIYVDLRQMVADANSDCQAQTALSKIYEPDVTTFNTYQNKISNAVKAFGKTLKTNLETFWNDASGIKKTIVDLKATYEGTTISGEALAATDFDWTEYDGKIAAIDEAFNTLPDPAVFDWDTDEPKSDADWKTAWSAYDYNTFNTLYSELVKENVISESPLVTEPAETNYKTLALNAFKKAAVTYLAGTFMPAAEAALVGTGTFDAPEDGSYAEKYATIQTTNKGILERHMKSNPGFETMWNELKGKYTSGETALANADLWQSVIEDNGGWEFAAVYFDYAGEWSTLYGNELDPDATNYYNMVNANAWLKNYYDEAVDFNAKLEVLNKLWNGDPEAADQAVKDGVKARIQKATAILNEIWVGSTTFAQRIAEIDKYFEDLDKNIDPEAGEPAFNLAMLNNYITNQVPDFLEDAKDKQASYLTITQLTAVKDAYTEAKGTIDGFDSDNSKADAIVAAENVLVTNIVTSTLEEVLAQEDILAKLYDELAAAVDPEVIETLYAELDKQINGTEDYTGIVLPELLDNTEALTATFGDHTVTVYKNYYDGVVDEEGKSITVFNLYGINNYAYLKATYDDLSEKLQNLKSDLLASVTRDGDGKITESKLLTYESALKERIKSLKDDIGGYQSSAWDAKANLDLNGNFIYSSGLGYDIERNANANEPYYEKVKKSQERYEAISADFNERLLSRYNVAIANQFDYVNWSDEDPNNSGQTCEQSYLNAASYNLNRIKNSSWSFNQFQQNAIRNFSTERILKDGSTLETFADGNHWPSVDAIINDIVAQLKTMVNLNLKALELDLVAELAGTEYDALVNNYEFDTDEDGTPELITTGANSLLTLYDQVNWRFTTEHKKGVTMREKDYLEIENNLNDLNKEINLSLGIGNLSYLSYTDIAADFDDNIWARFKDGTDEKMGAKDIVEELKSIYDKVVAVPEHALGNIAGALDGEGNPIPDAEDNVDLLDFNALLDYIFAPDDEKPAPGTPLFIACDLNGDGKLTVADAVKMINLIVYGTTAPDPSEFLARGMEQAAESAQLTLLSTEGNVRHYALSLSNVHAYSAFQVDIRTSEGMTVTEQLAERTAGRRMQARNVGSDVRRILAYSFNGTEIRGNEGAVLYFDVEGAGDIFVENVFFATAEGMEREFVIEGQTTGIMDRMANAYDAAKQKVYNMGGRMMDGLKKGINIIRRNNGETEKIIKK